MNVIEKHAQLFSELKIDKNLYWPEGIQMCPADGTRTLGDYAATSDQVFKHIDKIIVTQLISKKATVDGEEQLQGVMCADVFFRVKQGEAKVPVVHVLHSKNNLIIYMNSFWDFKKFNDLASTYPELKRVFM
jgi:hypothetical protein